LTLGRKSDFASYFRLTLQPPFYLHQIPNELLAERKDFIRNVTGGLGGSIYNVTTLADSGPGSLGEAAESSEPPWIVFGVSGTIRLNSQIDVESNKTVDGRGENIFGDELEPVWVLFLEAR
jgi:hypothetical protein